MTRFLQKSFGISAEGAKNLEKASLWSILLQIAMMVPTFLFLFFFQEALKSIAGEKAFLSPVFYIVMILVAYILIYILQGICYNSLYESTYKESETLRVRVAEKLRRLPISYFTKKDTSDLSSIILNDVETIETALSHVIPQLFSLIVLTVLLAVLLLFGDWRMGLAALSPIPVSFLLFFLSKKSQTRVTKAYYDELRVHGDRVQEVFEGAAEIRSFGRRDEVKAELFASLDHLEKTLIRSELMQGIPVNISAAILKLGLGVTIVAGSFLYMQGSLSLLFFVAYLIVASRIYDPISGMSITFSMLYYADARIRRLKSIEEYQTEEGTEKPVFPNYDITFRDVDFAYDDGRQVLKKLSFTAKQGEVTALIGPSGCGKTTVTRLISRLYEVSGGEIRIGGIPIRPIDSEEFMQDVSIVFQDVRLFHRSILENIRIGRKDATDEEVLEAARLANCDEFVNKLPEGYDTEIGEDGRLLSGGQRQRISIARAILKQAPIILLDEMSSSLDIETEHLVQEALRRLLKDKTVLIIAHRMKTIEKADHILLMEDGHLVGEGSHEELLKNSGLYRKMVEHSNLSESFRYEA